MNQFLKICIFVIIGSLFTSVNTNEAANFMKFFENPGEKPIPETIFGDNTKICFCGITTTLLSSARYGKGVDMYNLIKYDFNWLKASKEPPRANWSDAQMSNYHTGNTTWIGPADGSHLTYTVQSKKMESIIKHISKIFSAGGININSTPCKAYLSYFTAEFALLLKSKSNGKYILPTDADKEAFGKERGINIFMVKGKSKSYSMPYPVDPGSLNATLLEALKDGRGKKFEESDKEFIEDSMSMIPRINGVVCPIEVTRESNPNYNVKGAIIFIDNQTVKRFYFKKKKDTRYDFNYPTILEFIKENKKELKGDGTMSKVTSVRAFMFNLDLKEKEKLKDKNYVIQNMVLPNLFDITFCYSMLNPTDIGKIFDVTGIELYKMWLKYSNECPLVAMVGGITYMRGGEQIREPGLVKKPDDLFKFKEGNPNIPGDYYVDVTKIDFPDNPEYEKELEQKTTQIIEYREEVNKEIIKYKDPTPISYSDKIEVLTPKQMKEQLNNIVEDDLIEPEISEESDHKDDPIPSSIEIDLSPTDLIAYRNCMRMVIEYSVSLKGDVPDTLEKAILLVEKLLQFPIMLPLDETKNERCKQWLLFQFRTGLVLLVGGMEVMKWKITEVPATVLEKDKQDPNKKVWEIFFYNDNFEDRKEMVLYIPSDQLLNNWMQFGSILIEFHIFFEEQLAKSITLYSLYSELKDHIKSKLKPGWFVNDGPNGPEKLIGSSDSKKIKTVMNEKNEKYLNIILRISNGNIFYDMIYQAWYMNNKYIMMKVVGTQLNYRVVVCKYVRKVKLLGILDALYDAINTTYLEDTRVVSMYDVKELTFQYMKSILDEKELEMSLNVIDPSDKDFDDAIIGHENMKNSDNTAFMYNYMIKGMGVAIVIRGFIHNRESLPVVNFFFETEYFQSEYIIPLSEIGTFKLNIYKVMLECYDHLLDLYGAVKHVENPNTSADDIKKAQEDGHYTYEKLTTVIVSMLQKHAVYGCVAQLNLNREQEPSPKKYKWEDAENWDHNENLLIVRSNNLFKDLNSKCEFNERNNPTIVHLYSTLVGDHSGYALTVNGVNKAGDKELKTTYHFVKSQDYGHMQVMRNFVEKVLLDVFDPIETEESGG